MQAVIELQSMGYTFAVSDNDRLSYRLTNAAVDADRAAVLLAEIKANKTEAVDYLRRRSPQAAAATVEAIRNECLSLGWQTGQLDELQRLLASKDKMKVPCQVGMICKQSIEIQYLHQDGRIRGCGRYYNQRVKQPWNDLPE